MGARLSIIKGFLKKSLPSEANNTPKVRVIRKTWLPRWLRGDYTLKNSELLFSAVSRISNALSAMPIKLYRGSEEVKSDLNDIISFSPNPNMTSSQFFKTMEACRDTTGNAYALKAYDESGVLTRLDILDPGRVKPIMDKESGELWYRINPEEGNEIYVHGYNIIHIPFISTNGYSGINPVSVLLDTVSYSESIQKFSVEQLEKGINAAIVLEAPANLGKDQKKEMIDDFMETYKETTGNILLLESGVTAKSLNLSPVDSKLFEVEKITRSKVAMVYNLPPHLLGDYSDASFRSQEQQMLEFLMLTMLPIVTAYEQELNKKLLSREQRNAGYAFRFNMDSILRADASTQADVYQKSIRGGWMKPNEVRGKYNMPFEPEGNKLLAARDLTTLEYITQNPSGEKKEVVQNGQNRENDAA